MNIQEQICAIAERPPDSGGVSRSDQQRALIHLFDHRQAFPKDSNLTGAGAHDQAVQSPQVCRAVLASQPFLRRRAKCSVVNVYAKDIGNSHTWQQQIWAGFNVPPDGGVSAELLMAQAEGIPASTKAPEAFLKTGIEKLNEIGKSRFGSEVIKKHADFERLLRSIHRFRAIDEHGFYALAKDIARITADSIDLSALQKIVPVPPGQKRGSLKSLESVLASVIDPSEAATIMAPLFGAYDLRLADAHLPPSDIEDAFERVNAEQNTPWIEQGARILHAVVSCITRIGLAFANGK